MSIEIGPLLVIVFAILPGIPAQRTFQAFFGSNWRQSDWDKTVGVILFSIAGLILYIILSSKIGLPPPIYVFPSSFYPENFQIPALLPLAVSFLGHAASSEVFSLALVFTLKRVGRYLPNSPYPAAWDDFVRQDLPKHWIVVRLNSGEAYAGIIKYADISVNQKERDIVLSEPALFDNESKKFMAIPYQQLFLAANLVASIATVNNPESDKRITKVGSQLFD